MRYALIASGIVDNVVESETTIDGWTECPDHVSPGWQYVDGAFSEPEADPRVWWIDIGPFKDRLGMNAPAIYASAHEACKGVVGMVEGRKYIDLKDPRIAAMMGVLIAAAEPAANPVWPGSGPMTLAMRDAILNTPTTEYERHVKGLV